MGMVPDKRVNRPSWINKNKRLSGICLSVYRSPAFTPACITGYSSSFFNYAHPLTHSPTRPLTHHSPLTTHPPTTNGSTRRLPPQTQGDTLVVTLERGNVAGKSLERSDRTRWGGMLPQVESRERGRAWRPSFPQGGLFFCSMAVVVFD